MNINLATKTISFKVVYFGPGCCGKTTNVLKLSEIMGKEKPVILANSDDRTIFFDYTYLDQGEIGDFNIRLNIYTIPGQSLYKVSRKLILNGVDGIVFIADSSKSKLKENIESFKELQKYLEEMGIDIREIPIVIQYNKRDLPDALPVEELEKHINTIKAPYVESVAINGEGVVETINLLKDLMVKKYEKHIKDLVMGGKS